MGTTISSRIRIAVLAVIGSSVLTAFSVCTQAQYRFNHWTTDDGLPQNSVRSILQTRDGYLWFTTLDGVVRFDGVKFTVFNKGNTKGIQSNRFFALLEDREGSLWMATEDGGVCRYRAGSFTWFTTADGLTSNDVLSIHLNRDGVVTVYAHNGVSEWNGEKFAPHSPGPGEPSGGFICPERDGEIWSADDEGLHEYKEGRRVDFPIPGQAKPTSLYQDRDGTFWVGTNDGRLFSFKGGVFADSQLRLHPPNSFVQTTVKDRLGDLWIGTTGQGLIRLRNGEFSYHSPADGLSDDRIFSLFEDREGTLWAGTFNHGINRVDKQIISVYSSKDGMTGDIVYPIYQDREGAIWIGAEGLNRLDQGKFATYRQKDGFEFYDVMSIFQDRGNRLRLGAVGGLSYLEDGKIIDFTSHIPLMRHNFNVWAIYQDPTGALWFGTDHGLIRYTDQSVIRYTTKDGLAGDDVKCIHPARDGRLWFGTYGGLSYLRNGKFTSLTQSDGLASNRVRTIYEDQDGALWIGTYDGGLSRYKGGRFTNYTTANGLFNNGVFQIIDDLKGNFWIGCNRGIYRVSRQELNDFADGKIKTINSISYGRVDGLISTECNGGRQPSGLRTPDGRIWIPTQAGVAVIDAANLTVNPLAPPIVIEGAIVNRRTIEIGRGLELRPGDSNLEIDYTALSFIKPEQVRFRYMMEGLDHDWVDAGSRRAAYYAYLLPGSYTFIVSAANSNGVWNTQPQRLSITVLPPFWRTWWFILISVAAIAGSVILAYRRRISILQRAQEAQQEFSRQLIYSQESERKRIAAELHDSLGQNLLVIKNWAVLGLGAIKDDGAARAELTEISSAASQAINEVREISYNLRPHLLDEVGLSEALKAMIRRVAAASGIVFSIEIDPIDGAFSKEAEISVYRIVQEGVNNIVRHSRATEATVGIRKDEGEVVVDIVDNGIGLSPGPAPDGRKGFGLAGISERARMLGGKLTSYSATPSVASSASGQGTRLEVRLPIGRNEK